jgi:hypothetical protein
MKRRRVLGAVAGVATASGCLSRVRGGVPSAGQSESLEYERGTVTVFDEDGTCLATVDVRIADTQTKRYVGLSDTESLSEDEGMLFVHERESEHAYVMREMDFPLDIVFVDADHTITTVHHAPLPPETSGDDLKRYRGRGKYVLEVPEGYTDRRGISPGDCVRIDREEGAAGSTTEEE